jgi:hypothetical protein
MRVPLSQYSRLEICIFHHCVRCATYFSAHLARSAMGFKECMGTNISSRKGRLPCCAMLERVMFID